MHLSGVPDQILVDILGGTSHVDLALVVILGQVVGEGSAVIEVGVGDDDHFHFCWVDRVEEGQAVGVFLVDHESAVEHDLLVVDGEDEAGAADLAACAQG